MTFDDVWALFGTLRGRRLHTLDQQQPFTVEQVAPTSLVVRVERTGNLRPIQRADFEDAWQRLTQMGRLSRTEIHREISRFNPAYVATLLAQIPGVRYTLRPIVLSRAGAPTVPPQAAPPPAGGPSAPQLEEDEEPGGEEVEETLADRLAQYGQRAGFEARKEWRTDIGNRIDLVWARPLPAGFPGARQGELLPIVGFEIESSWRTRKHVKGDIFNLQDLSPALGVIVLCKGADDEQDQIDSLRQAAQRYIGKLGLRIQVWTDADVEHLLRR